MDSGRGGAGDGAGRIHRVGRGERSGGPLGAVKARQAYMQLNGFYMGQLAAVAKGQVPYDAAQATGIANSLLALASMDVGAMWPPGSGNDNPALAGKTRALPEIWTTFPAVVEKADAAEQGAGGDGGGGGNRPRQPSGCLRRRRCRLRRLPSQLPRREVLTRGCISYPSGAGARSARLATRQRRGAPLARSGPLCGRPSGARG